MKHLGDITKISGYEVEPVDIICGGSPCQDLSVAGKRAGLAVSEKVDDTLRRESSFRVNKIMQGANPCPQVNL